MSVKIRLRRMGKKKQPHYRIVVADSRSPRDGRFVENLGYYSPVREPALLKVDLDRVDYWLGEGAIASPTVGSLVSKARVGGDDTVALAEADSEPTAGVAEDALDASAAAEGEVDGEAAGDADAAADAGAGADAGAASDAGAPPADESE